MTRKKSDTLTAADLVVLSLLAEQPMHGYKIVSELENRDAKDWAPVSKPQVYYSIKKLAELNLIATASDKDEAQGPEREKFKIRSAGFAAMNEALGRLEWAKQRPPAPFTTWMALSSHLSPEKTRELIGARQDYLTDELARERKTLKDFESQRDPMFTAGKLMVSFCIQSFELELNWLERVMKELPSCRKGNG